MFKKLVIMVLILTLVLTATSTAFASTTAVESKIGFVLDGKIQSWNEVSLGKIFLSSGRSFVPLRVVSEKLGYAVTWEQKTSSAIIQKGDVKITFKIGASEVTTPSGVVELDVASFVMNGRTYVPMRGLFEALGADIEWVTAKMTASNLGVSMSTLTKDFYVVVKSGSAVQEVVTQSQSFYDNIIVNDLVVKYPEFTKIHSEYTFVFSKNPDDIRNAYLSLYDLNDIGQYQYTIQGWSNEGVAEALLSLLKVSTKDYQEIYDEWISAIKNNGQTKADETWVKTKNGTEYKFTSENIHGVAILVKK